MSDTCRCGAVLDDDAHTLHDDHCLPGHDCRCDTLVCPDCCPTCALDDRQPCHTCKRVHRPPECDPEAPRSTSRYVYLPGYLDRELVELVPWGERSAFVAQAVEEKLDRLAGVVA